jgi:hypothetical protein
LEAFLTRQQFTARTEVRLFVENLTVALSELKQLGFAHGDLHSRNIMREVIGEGGPVPGVQYVVIDFSEAHPVENTQEGLLEDFQQFGHHLRHFADSIHRRDDVSRDDGRVLAAIEHLAGLLSGLTADTIRLWSPLEILRTFQEGLRSAEEAPKKLRTPFDSLSAENITNDALLTKLCFTTNWWAAELEKPGNTLLVGPRGCGKSMLFRRLRLKTKISAGRTNELKSDSFAGFYIPCESVFFNRFSDLTDPLVDRYGDALVLFFNMAITVEVFSTLALLPEWLGSVNSSTVEALRQVVDEEVGPLSELLDSPHSVIALSDLSERADHAMRWIRRAIAYGNELRARGSMDYIARLVDKVKDQIPSLSRRTFIFFLDDYTQERVPLALQKILHPIVCQRSGEVSFKISAHMFGSIYSYPQPLALDEGRNIVVINLGAQYVNPKRKKAERNALIKIMNTRFNECEEYEGPIEEWLGHSTYPEGKSLNRALHGRNTRDKVRYNGIECLQQLCTGDISEMIRTIRDIFNEAQIDGGQPRLIPARTQDKAIRNVSRDFLSRVRHIRLDGQRLYDILNAFGSLSKQLLYERALVRQGTDSTGKQRTDPYDLLTIYVDEITKASAGARHTWERLQQASIFVDILLAPSQRSVIADRVTLRRIYCPAFATTLTSSEHLQLNRGQFEWFVEAPGEFCAEYIRRNIGMSRGPSLWEGSDQLPEEPVESAPISALPRVKFQHDFAGDAPVRFTEMTSTLPALQKLEDAIVSKATFDLFVGAMGFEERTFGAAAALVKQHVKVSRVFMLEFDLYYKATEPRRKPYRDLIAKLTDGQPFEPINAPVGSPDLIFPERMKEVLAAVSGASNPKILFDCTSCPSVVLSKCLRVLLEFPCELTILYSEAGEYYPTRREWEGGTTQRDGGRVEGPFSGVRYVEKPPLLQSDDSGERPISLVLFPSFNTERTSGVLTDQEPVKRVWLFGEPHNLSNDGYRIEMAQSFAAPLVVEEDQWSVISTFDYRKTMDALAGIYVRDRPNYRFAVMPHGSKMQTLGVGLFAAAHQVPMVFAVAKNYDPQRYSRGCAQTWAIRLGSTTALVERLKRARALSV